MFQLNYETVGPEQAPSWIAMAHGIFGRGGNWRRIAKDITDRLSNWGIILIDLPAHGRSIDAPAPNTVNHAASQVQSLLAKLSEQGMATKVLAGHSFGGKVMLQAAKTFAPQRLWLLDSSPDPVAAPRSDATSPLFVLDFATEVRDSVFSSRSEFIDAMTQQGFSKPLATWFAMNLEHTGDHYRLAINPKAIAELLHDYYQLDAWHNPPNCHVDLIIGETSKVVSSNAQKRAQALGWHLHVLAKAGHWLHVDQPKALVDLLTQELAP